jgi:hypothetical protein
MTRTATLPPSLLEWIKQRPEASLRAAMRRSVLQRLSTHGVRTDSASIAADRERLDERYFELSRADKEDEAMSFFQLARACACLEFLDEGSFTEAAYEFCHSLDDLSAEGAEREINRAEQARPDNAG